MNERRRLFLTALVPGAVVAAGAALVGAQPRNFLYQLPGQFPQNQQPPVLPPLPSPPSKAELKQNQEDIKKDVDQLFSLAQDLKDQVSKTDSSRVLSVSFYQKAEKIEKLAKKIRDLQRY